MAPKDSEPTFRRLRQLALALILSALALLAERQGLVARLDFFLQDIRFAHAERASSGQFIFIAIDPKSLRDVGSWPWSRQVHADILDHLTEAGAGDVFFDVDFAFAGDQHGDLAFAEALDKAGSAYLAVFAQSNRRAEAATHFNLPYAEFAARSWPVSVNIFADESGIVRDYPFGTQIEDAFVPSAAAMLAGHFIESQNEFGINFSIIPGSVPIVSASDVATGLVPLDFLAGRSIIIGASAIELGDHFAVPVHGVIPGALIHALAAETLAEGLVPTKLRAEAVLLLLFIFFVVAQDERMQKPARFFGALGLCLLASEASAFALFARASIVTPTGVLYPALAAFSTWFLVRRLNLSDWMIRHQTAQVKKTTDLLEQVFQDSSDAIVIVDEKGVINTHSISAAALFGLRSDGSLDLPDRLRRAALVTLAVASDGLADNVRQIELHCGGKLRHLEFTVTPSASFEIVRGSICPTQIATLYVRDTTKLREQERQIAYLSNHDKLTDALRRDVFLSFLDLRIEVGDPFAIFVINLHRFKTVNAILGRKIGDQLLVEVVRRIEKAGLGLSAVARLGGDTFAVYSETRKETNEASKLAIALGDLISAPYLLEGARSQIGSRIGYYVVAPNMQIDAADALSRSEEALEIARDARTMKPQLYNPALSNKQFRAREIERLMVGALEEGEFHVVYQPQHSLSDGKLIGSEALVRWESARLGQIGPDEFIEIAESNGFIVELGQWVLRQSLQDGLQMPGKLDVAVNISGIQLLHGDVVGDLNAALAETKFPASRLCLELTESVFLSSTSSLIETMSEVHAKGVAWALDDFGTGYSSMAYLSKMPLEKIKLDRSFINSLGEDASALSILSSVSDLCKGLGFTLLCEGVETESQLALLKENGCAEAQGYLYGRPMKLDVFLNYCQSQAATGVSSQTDQQATL